MKTPLDTREIQVLLVEDSPADALMTREALGRVELPVKLNQVEDGREALAYLRRVGRFADAVRPDLILLDLNLPRMDGREVLVEIKADPDLRLIPIVILTTSQTEEDVLRASGGHANGYVPKPLDFRRFLEVVRSIQRFWFEVATLSGELRDR